MIILKKMFICILCINLLLMTGCNSNVSVHELAQEDAKMVFDLIQNRDVNKLSELFSDAVKSKHDVEAELDNFFENIDGKLTEYKKLEITSESEAYDKEGVLYKQSAGIKFDNVSSDNGTVYYAIVYSHTFVDQNKSDSEGLNGLRLIIKESDDLSEYIEVGF